MDASGAIELLKQIISIPSFSKEEDKVADLIADVLKRYRFDVHRKGNNVWSRSKNFDDAKLTLLLDAHLDTVRPNGIWDSDPFTPVVKEGKLFGLGSNDTGGSLVSMLAVFVELASGSLPCNLIFLASAEEENTGSGGIQSVFPELGRVCPCGRAYGNVSGDSGEGVDGVGWLRPGKSGTRCKGGRGECHL